MKVKDHFMTDHGKLKTQAMLAADEDYQKWLDKLKQEPEQEPQQEREDENR